jgi:hypothetical protein
VVTVPVQKSHSRAILASRQFHIRPPSAAGPARRRPAGLASPAVSGPRSATRASTSSTSPGRSAVSRVIPSITAHGASIAGSQVVA